MQSLILAAGRGSRLGQNGNDTPKCLLEVGRRPIIEHQLQALAEAGIGPVGMVIGYCGDEIRSRVGIQAEYIVNSKWHMTNSLYSFLLAREWVRGPLVILNSDILFDPEILNRLLAVEGDAIVYDSTSGNGREHMKVSVADRRLVDMSKSVPAELVSGENIGILCFSADAVDALFEKAQEIVNERGEDQWLGAAVRELARERTIRAVDVKGLPWGEIDIPYDLDRVRKEVWPAIRRNNGPGRKIARPVVRWAALLLVLALGVFLTIRSLRPPVERNWETVELTQARTVEITDGARKKKWVLLGKQNVQAQIVGPGLAQIDTRLLREEAAAQEAVPYVLDIELDGQRIDLFKLEGLPSASWHHPQWMVSKLRRLIIDIPSGMHTLRVRLIGPEEAHSCLLRVRQLEPAVEKE